MRLFALPAVVLLWTAASFAGWGALVAPAGILGSTPAAAEPASEGAITVTASVALGPIVGAPKPVIERVIRMLDAASRRADLALLNYSGAQGDYRLQGDLKADMQGSKIRISYRWLVFDKSRAELGRVAGAQTVPGTAADPWGEISDAVLETMAQRAMAVVLRAANVAAPAASAPASLAQSGPGGPRENTPVVVSPAAQPALLHQQQELVIDTSGALKLVNDYRRSNGLRPLTLHNSLAIAAAALAADMAKNNRLSHTGPNGAGLAKRLKVAGYNFGLAAENIGAGQSTIIELIESWKNDPSQSRNLLLPDATQMGIAYKYRPDTNYKTYWTLVVAAP